MLLVLVGLPHVVSLVVALSLPFTARFCTSLRPSYGAWATFATIVTLGAGSAGALALLGWYSVARIPWIAALGPWPHQEAAHASPIPLLVADLAALIALAGGLVAIADGVRALYTVWRAHRWASKLPAGDLPGCAIAPDDVPGAFVVPPLPGRPAGVVFTQGLLDLVVDPQQQRAVYFHEIAHARLGHVWLRVVARGAARLNPMLRPLLRKLDHFIECWADDRAANVVGPRPVATALAAVALAQPPQGPTLMLRATGGDVVTRVHRLVEEPSECRLLPVAGATVLCGLILGVVVAACRITEKTFEHLMDLL